MIRKVIATVIISLVTLNYIQAQDKFKRELSLGASFGTTFSKVSFAQTKVQQKMKMGYTGGLTLRWITEKNLGLQAELNFIQHGWDEKFEDQPQYKYSRTINYFELPILTHIYFGSKRFRVFVNLGPKIGYAFGEKTDENLNGAKPNTMALLDCVFTPSGQYSSARTDNGNMSKTVHTARKNAVTRVYFFIFIRLPNS